MKRIYVLFLFLLPMVVWSQQRKPKIKGNRKVTRVTERLPAFHSILLKDDLDVSVVASKSPSYNLVADDNLVDVITLKVVDSVLEIRSFYKITSRKELEITINYERLKSIEVQNGTISTDNILNTGRLQLSASGNANLNVSGKAGAIDVDLRNTSQSDLNLDTERLSIEMGDRSDARIYSTCEDLNVNLVQNAVLTMEGEARVAVITQSQQSKYKGEAAPITRLQLNCSGNAQARIHVTEVAGVKAKGGSKVFLFGNPSIDLQEFMDTAQLSKKPLE